MTQLVFCLYNFDTIIDSLTVCLLTADLQSMLPMLLTLAGAAALVCVDRPVFGAFVLFAASL